MADPRVPPRARPEQDARLREVIRDVQAWVSAGNYTVSGYPPHNHVWCEDDGVCLTNPVIYHRTCERCQLRQERRGNSDVWAFDLFENLIHLVSRLQTIEVGSGDPR